MPDYIKTGTREKGTTIWCWFCWVKSRPTKPRAARRDVFFKEKDSHATTRIVMAGLDPAIHVFCFTNLVALAPVVSLYQKRAA
jgi:hypothetical protein